MLLVASHLCAQQPSLKFDHIGLEQGLSESIVLAITQDTKGYMWFGTADGLNRFDGYEFEVFKNVSTDLICTILSTSDSSTTNMIQTRREGSPLGLNDDDVASVVEDSSGALWIATWEGGLSRLDPRGYLWIVSEGNGLDRLNLREVDSQRPEKTRFKHYP